MTWNEYKLKLSEDERKTIFVKNRKASKGYMNHYFKWKRKEGIVYKGSSPKRVSERHRRRIDAMTEEELNLYRKKQAAFQRKHRLKHPRKVYEKIFSNIRLRIRCFMKGAVSIETEKILGISTQGFRNYLESKFSEDMTWENYGHGLDKWTIDHIIPISSCRNQDGSIDKEKLIKLNHYTNLQPLWLSDNCSKKSRTDFRKR